MSEEVKSLGMETFQIINEGLVSTIQDLGRKPNLAKKIPSSGALDRVAFRMGNLLVRNPLDDAAIEMTGEGVKLHVLRDTAIAITGGVFNVDLNGYDIEQWCTTKVYRGDIISIGEAISGWCCYLCVAGGIDVPSVLGSKSTYVKGGVGGFKGRPLEKGDVLRVRTPKVPLNTLHDRKVKDGLLPRMEGVCELRIVLQPGFENLKDESKEVFLNSSYRVSSESNRVLYRFEGPQLMFKKDENPRNLELNSLNLSGVPGSNGTIQVVEGGEITSTGPDFVPMGSYIGVARLVTPDLDRIAQLRPESHLRFKVVTPDDAILILNQSLRCINEENITSCGELYDRNESFQDCAKPT